MKKLFIALIYTCFVLPFLWSQEAPQSAPQNAGQKTSTPLKFALVIGNSAYTGLSRLANPINDANDISGVLQELGFTVDKVLNGSLEQMEEAVARLKDNLSNAGDSATGAGAYGFFFYAGHGVQSGGENYLIPVDANIPSESYLRNRSLSVQIILDDLNEARNSLNVVVLDACRDNPFGWGRSANRGLAMITRQPADSIIVYATSAGQQASDGDGERNGLFTGQLINNLADQSLDVNEVFRRTGADVSEVSQRRQIPAIYNQFFGIAYLGNPGEIAEQVRTRPANRPLQPSGGNRDNTQLWSIGASVGSSFSSPLVIVTVRGTLAPLRFSFIEIGFDAGFASTSKNTNSYYSLCPYAHYALFLPFAEGGWYAGGGGGLWRTEYRYDDLSVPETTFAADLSIGLLIKNFLDISYTLRTNFNKTSGKIALGYVYRFK